MHQSDQCHNLQLCFCRSSWLNYYKVWGVPVLVAMNTADTARQLEGMTDKEVIGDALKVCVLLGQPSRPAGCYSWQCICGKVTLWEA